MEDTTAPPDILAAFGNTVNANMATLSQRAGNDQLPTETESSKGSRMDIRGLVSKEQHKQAQLQQQNPDQPVQQPPPLPQDQPESQDPAAIFNRQVEEQQRKQALVQPTQIPQIPVQRPPIQQQGLPQPVIGDIDSVEKMLSFQTAILLKIGELTTLVEKLISDKEKT